MTSMGVAHFSATLSPEDSLYSPSGWYVFDVAKCTTDYCGMRLAFYVHEASQLEFFFIRFFDHAPARTPYSPYSTMLVHSL